VRPAWNASFSPDTHKVVSSPPDGYTGAEIADSRAGLCVPLEASGRTFFASFDETGRRVVTAGDLGTIKVWSDHGELLHRITDPAEDIVHSAMLRGDRVLTAAADGVARLWSLDGEVLREFRGHGDRVYRARWSPDGRFVLTCSGDSTARLWDLDGNTLMVFRGHRAIIKDAQFSPDGQRILTASRDGTARVWSLDGKELYALRSAYDLIAANFRPDGRRIVTLDEHGTARVWIADVDELIASAEKRLAHRRFRPEDLEPYRELLGNRFQALSAERSH
jgi:WD40 repeat protein